MIKTFYDAIVRTNDKIIGLTEEVIPIVFYIRDEEIVPQPLNITKNNKDKIKLDIKANAVKNGAGYVLILNTEAKRKKHGVEIKGACCIRALYTPKEKIIDMVWHKEGEILARERIEGRNGPFIDEYDAWTI